MRARPAQRIAVGADAGQLERAVGFHRGADVGGASDEDIEAAIGQLAFQNGVGGLLDARRGGRIPGLVLGLVQKELQQDVIGFEGGVGGQLAAPKTFGRLQGQQGLGGALKRGGSLLARGASGAFHVAVLAQPRGFRPF